MNHAPLTDKQVEMRRAENRLEKWSRLASFAFTARGREWAERNAARARADIKRLQEEKA